MEKAKDYFDREYDGNHIETVVDMFDLKSLYGLIEEYAESQVKKTTISNVVISLPSEEDIFNEATIHGKRLFDADLDTDKVDLIQSSMRFMREIIIELNNKPTP